MNVIVHSRDTRFFQNCCYQKGMDFQHIFTAEFLAQLQYDVLAQSALLYNGCGLVIETFSQSTFICISINSGVLLICGLTVLHDLYLSR